MNLSAEKLIALLTIPGYFRRGGRVASGGGTETPGGRATMFGGGIAVAASQFIYNPFFFVTSRRGRISASVDTARSPA